MKKLFYVMALSTLMLAACGEEEVKTKEETGDTTSETVVKKESEYPFPDSAPLGNAVITVSTASGDSSNGNVPVLFVNEDDLLNQIGVEYENFDGSIETYVYINGIFLEKDQIGELMQSTLSLTGDNLKPGDYTVTAVQFTDNDPNKDPVTLTEAKFKIEQTN